MPEFVYGLRRRDAVRGELIRKGRDEIYLTFSILLKPLGILFRIRRKMLLLHIIGVGG